MMSLYVSENDYCVLDVSKKILYNLQNNNNQTIKRNHRLNSTKHIKHTKRTW